MLAAQTQPGIFSSTEVLAEIEQQQQDGNPDWASQINGQLAAHLYLVKSLPVCMVSRLMQQAVARLGSDSTLVSSSRQRTGLLDQAYTAARIRLAEQLVR